MGEEYFRGLCRKFAWIYQVRYISSHSQNMEEKAIIWSMVVIWLPLFAIPVFVFTSNILKVVDSIFQGMLLFLWIYFRSRAAALDPMRSVYRSDKMKEADVLLAVKDVGWFWGVAVFLKICVTSCLGWSCVQCAWKGHCCYQPLLWIFYSLWYK